MKIFVLMVFFVFCYVCTAKAQICNTDPGNPIIKITFGTQKTALPGKTTTYDYVRGCPLKGQYTIQNLIFGCGETPDAHSWHQLAGDHTRDQNGQYMLVNAQSTPGTVYIDSARELCENTTYQYTAWLADVMRDNACGGQPVLPDITFSVSTLSGQLLATVNTGAIPVEDSRVWHQYGLVFTMPPGADAVVLTLTTQPKYGCGSAFVVDDIILSMCGPAVTATIDGKTEPANVCADYTNPFLLGVSYDPGLNDPVVQWQNSMDSGKTWSDIPSQVALSYQVPRRAAGTIMYRAAVAERANISSLNCRVVSNPIYTEVHPLPGHHAPENVIGCTNKSLVLPPSDPTALKVQWSGPNGYHSDNPVSVVPDINYNDTGLYRLKQEFYFGCISIDTFNVKVFPSTTVSTQTLYSICEGQSISLAASGEGNFTWAPSEGLSNSNTPNPVATPRDSTIYKVEVSNSFGCKDSAYVTVNVFKNPMANAGKNSTIVAGDTVLLNASLKGTAVNYAWNPVMYMDNPGLIAPHVFPPESTEYTLTVTSTVGCGSSSSAVLIKVYKAIFVPSAFTPDGNGKNDKFKIFAIDSYKIEKFVVYNRWGKQIFSAKNADDGWDGKFNSEPQPAGSYIYYLELLTSAGTKITKKGAITLLR